MMRMKRGTRIGWVLVAFSIILSGWVIASGFTISASDAGANDSVGTLSIELTDNETVTIDAMKYKNNDTVTALSVTGTGTLVIGESAFMSCKNLKTVSIADGINVQVGNLAFASCPNLANAILGHLGSFGQKPFDGDYLSSISVSNGDTESYHVECNGHALYLDTTLLYVTQTTQALTLWENTSAIADYAFDNSNVTTLIIPSGCKVVSIGTQNAWPGNTAETHLTVRVNESDETTAVKNFFEPLVPERVTIINTANGSTSDSGNTDSGNTDSGNTGGNTDSGNTGGNTGGNTDSGNTGGNTGGNTDSGNTGGNTGGNTDSGNTGGNNGGGSGSSGSTNSTVSISSGGSGGDGGSSSGVNTAAPTVSIIEGANQKVAQNYGAVTIKSNGEFSKFAFVMFDYTILDKSNYIAKSGSTVVTFKADFISSLSEGTHNVRFYYSTGEWAETNLVIDNTAKKTTTTVTYTVNSNGTVSKGTGKDATPTTADGFDERMFLCLGILLCGIGTILYSKNKKLELLTTGYDE